MCRFTGETGSAWSGLAELELSVYWEKHAQFHISSSEFSYGEQLRLGQVINKSLNQTVDFALCLQPSARKKRYNLASC